MRKKTERVQMVFSPDELAALDAWAEAKGHWSRSAAIRDCISIALAVAEKLAREKKG